MCSNFRSRRNTLDALSRGLALLLVVLAFAAVSLPRPSWAAGLTDLEAGPYRADLWTEPAVVPVGKARLFVRLRDAEGAPVAGATVRTLVKMPAMDMGEREVAAAPVPERPGVYVAPAAFAMAGEYTATVRIAGAEGAAELSAPVSTGQTTAAPAAPGAAPSGERPPAAPRVPWNLLLWAGALAVAGFVVYRLWRLGARPDGRALLRPPVLLSIFLVLAVIVASRVAISRLRPPGSMTPVEAQAMEMELPAPPNPAPVEMATVREGSLESTVRYSGQAVGYSETVAAARGAGWIDWMPFYVGDRLRKGQVVARLDTSQTAPQEAERAAQAAMARQEEAVSGSEHRAALAEVRRMQAEARARRAAAEGAEGEVAAMRAEVDEARAEQAAMQADVAAMRAEVESAEADLAYWREEIRRIEALLARGAVSQEEFQREKAQAIAAQAKRTSAAAALAKAEAQVRAAGTRLARAQSQVTVALNRRRQMHADAEGAEEAVAAARTETDAARARIGQARAGARQARAGLAAAAAARGYSEVRSPVDGVVTERLVSPGTLAAAGQALLKIAQVAPIRLQVFVPEADLADIRKGAAVRAWAATDPGAPAGAPVRVTVTSVGASFDPASRMAAVEATYPNRDGRFRPGQAVTLEVVTGRSGTDSPIVPTRALRWQSTGTEGSVLSHDRRAFVWVVEGGEPATARPVAVTVGRSGGLETEILAGLKAGQRVLTRGQEDLRPGDAVQAVAYGAEGPVALPSPATLPVAGKGEATTGHAH